MNTGSKIKTNRLELRPGNNETDNAPFLKMLKEEGDFEFFSGIPYTEEHLGFFDCFFERDFSDYCIYSIYLEDKFIGYAGFHREDHGYELEFYVSKPYRQNGYAKEACLAVMDKLFDEGISVDGKIIKEERLYATTIIDNIPTKALLEGLGFKDKAKTDDGGVIIATGYINEEDDEFYASLVDTYLIEKRKDA